MSVWRSLSTISNTIGETVKGWWQNKIMISSSLIALLNACENKKTSPQKDYFPDVIQKIEQVKNGAPKEIPNMLDLIQKNVEESVDDTVKIEELKTIVKMAKTDILKKLSYEQHEIFLKDVADDIMSNSNPSLEEKNLMLEIIKIVKDWANYYGLKSTDTPKNIQKGQEVGALCLQYLEWLEKNDPEKVFKFPLLELKGKINNILGSRNPNYEQALEQLHASLDAKKRFYNTGREKKEATLEAEISSLLSVLNTLVNIHYCHVKHMGKDSALLDEDKVYNTYREIKETIDELKILIVRLPDEKKKEMRNALFDLSSLSWINHHGGLKNKFVHNNTEFSLQQIIQQGQWVLDFAKKNEDPRLGKLVSQVIIKIAKNPEDLGKRLLEDIKYYLDLDEKNDESMAKEHSNNIEIAHIQDEHQEELDVQKEREWWQMLTLGGVSLTLLMVSLMYWRNIRQKAIIKEQNKKLEEKQKIIEKVNQELAESNMELQIAYDEIQTQKEEVDAQNEKLQRMVELGKVFVEELQRQKKEINLKNEELQAIIEALNKANDQLELKNIKAISEKNYAAGLQQYMILPNQENIDDMLGIGCCEVIYDPKSIVSGDFYVAEKINVRGEEMKLLGVVDCTGHGVPGAMLSTAVNGMIEHQTHRIDTEGIIIKFLEETLEKIQKNPIFSEHKKTNIITLLSNLIESEIHSFHKENDPAEILTSLLNGINEEFRTNFAKNANARAESNDGRGDGMECGICLVYDGKLYFSGSQRSMIVISGDQMEIYKAPLINIAVIQKYGGMFEKEEHVKVIDLEEIDLNAKIYFFSDGITDLLGGPNKSKFGTPRFKKLTQKVSHLSTKEIKDIIQKTRRMRLQGKNPFDMDTFKNYEGETVPLEEFLNLEVKDISCDDPNDDTTIMILQNPLYFEQSQKTIDTTNITKNNISKSNIPLRNGIASPVPIGSENRE